MNIQISEVTIWLSYTGVLLFLAGMVGRYINYWRDRLNPDDPYEFVKKYLGKKVEYKHSTYKVTITGSIYGIELGKGNVGKGKPNFNIVITDGNSKYRESLYQEGKSWRIIK